MPDNLPNIMSVTELREYLHISTKSAYDLVKRKDFPSFRIGNKYFVCADKLADWFVKRTLCAK